MRLHSSTLPSLRFFERTARLLSFKQAAAELHVTHGAVSQQVKHLESVLGVKLFYRLSRHITLTPEGKRFAEVVSRSLHDIDAAARAITAAKSDRLIRLRVGPSFALRWLLPRIPDFYRQHPRIQLNITGAYGHIDPADRSFDLAIEHSNGEYQGLQSRLLMPEFIAPVCSPTYLAEHHFLRTPDDLERCTLLHDAHAWCGQDEGAEWRYWLQEVRATRVDSQQGLFFSLADMSMEAARQHQGVAMSRAALSSDLLNTGELVMPLGLRIKSPAGYFLVCPKEMIEQPAVETLMRWLAEQV